MTGPAWHRHLVALVDRPDWRPATNGEWSAARAMQRRGLVRRNPGRDQAPFELTRKGRDLAEILPHVARHPIP